MDETTFQIFWILIILVIIGFFVKMIKRSSQEMFKRDNQLNEISRTIRDDFNKKTKLKEKEKIEEIVSSDLLRIIIKAFGAEFACFEFKKDSINIYDLKKHINSFDKVNGEYFCKNVEYPLFKVEIVSHAIKSGKMIDHFNGSDKEITDFKIETLGDESMKFLGITKFEKFNDGSSGWHLMNVGIDISELKKAERILFLLKNVTSFSDMKLLEESYSNYESDLLGKKELLIKELDSDGNGVLDIAENQDFLKLLKIRQKQIIEFDKSEGQNYIQNFIKLSNYLNDNASNIQILFKYLKDDPNIPNTDYNNYVGVLKNKINTFQMMLLSSMNMIISLTEDDRLTFYEIYETFDKLNVFSSNHEKEISAQLKNLDNKLIQIIESINHMEISISSELYKLQFISEGISDSLNGLSNGLSEINSSIQLNNLITGMQTYQLYKINLNTKSLN